MDVLYRKCAGLDVHKKSVTSCARIAGAQGATVTREVVEHATTTADLVALAEWLTALGVTHIAMEATGVYWKPVWHILSEFGFELVLANAAHVKNVPGRKTDVADAVWLADLLAHGLIRASFVPPRQTEELRTLMRTRKQFVRERVAHVQRIQKVLETANIKLDSIISDIVGKSGRAILDALVAGESDPVRLARLASARIQASPRQLAQALTGRVTPHHRFMLTLHLKQIDAVNGALATIDAEADAALGPFQAAVELLATMDGIAHLSATAILAEIGFDMSRFASDGHLVSWACLAPRNDESAGKRRSTRLRKGGNWLKTLLVQCAWAAVTRKGRPLRVEFERIRARRGAKKAIIAVAASMLRAIYHMLKKGEPYRPARPDPAAAARHELHRIAKRLKALGYAMQITPNQPVEPASVPF